MFIIFHLFTFQKKVSIEVYENSEDTVQTEITDSVMIGECTLAIKGDLPKDSPLTVSLDLNENGVLHVKGYEKTGKTEVETYIQTEALLNEGDLIAEQEQIANMLIVV